MRLIPNSQAAWAEYSRTRKLRGLPPVHAGEDSLMVADGQALVAGCCLYPTHGPYVFAEHLTTNPGMPLTVRHRAVSILASALKVYCAARGKQPVLVVRHRGLLRLLRRVGYTVQPCAVMTTEPVMELGDLPR